MKRVFYATCSIGTDGSATYGTPKAFPGAVNISLEPQGDITNFYADDIVYWAGANNNGYQGDLEMALISDDFRKDCLGEAADGKSVLVESVNNSSQHFALLFEFTGDQSQKRHVFYNCVANRPSVAGATKGESRLIVEKFEFLDGKSNTEPKEEKKSDGRPRQSLDDFLNVPDGLVDELPFN